MKVLLVDDSQVIRKILRTQLSGFGITEIVEATNGQEALETLSKDSTITTVALDINMPVMDGMTCLRKIRANPAFSKVKVIMVTSESEKTKVIEAVEAGATNYIVKPFTPDIIKEKFGL